MTEISSDERTQLIRLVEFLMSAQGTEEEQDEALRSLESRVPHPRVSDLIFWPQYEGFDQLTPQQVVDTALAYRPIEL
jgi:Colicin immunity protein / pyocin immunity protein